MERETIASELNDLASYLMVGATQPSALNRRCEDTYRQLKDLGATLEADHPLRDFIKAAIWNVKMLTIDGRMDVMEEACLRAEEVNSKYPDINVTWERYAQLPEINDAYFEKVAKQLQELAAKISPKPHPDDEARGGTEELIPTEFRSKPKSKDILARLHSGERQDNPSQYLKRAGVRAVGKRNSKLWIADIRQFDKTAHEELLS